MYRILSSKRFQRFVAGIILPVFLFVVVLGTPLSAMAQTIHESHATQIAQASAVRTGSVVQLSQATGALGFAKIVGATALGSFLGGLGSDAAGLLIFYWIFSTIVEIFSKIVNELLIWSLRTFILLTGYNDFLNNEFVNSGWATLRDIANLFFVVILLVIAFATVLNISSYEYQQLLPKFILAIFLVNFSRTIVGLMIDASQVVMVTFASAFYQSAAGNFIRLLRIDQWLQVKSVVSSAIATAGSATGSEAIKAITSAISGVDIVSNFVALLFTMAVATFALGVGLTLVAVIVYRIVALWLLIIFSPLAFLAWVLPSTNSYFSQWMGYLVKQLTVGPLLVFVVWLALSTVQQNPQSYALIENSQSITQIMSSLGMTSGYAELDNASALNAGLQQSVGDNQIASTAISSWNNLTAFVVAITVLIGGIKFASGMSGGAGAFAEKLAGYTRKPFDIAEKKAMGFGKWAGKKAIGEPTNESAWYLRNKKEAKLLPGIGRFYKSSEERIRDSEQFNLAYYADQKGIRNVGKGRYSMNQLETAKRKELEELSFQNSDEIFDYAKSDLSKGGDGAVINADGKSFGAATKFLPGKWKAKNVEDAAKLRAARDMYLEKKRSEIDKEQSYVHLEDIAQRRVAADGSVEEINVKRENAGKTKENRDKALKSAMAKFDSELKIGTHSPKDERFDPGDRSNKETPEISGHIVRNPRKDSPDEDGIDEPGVGSDSDDDISGGGIDEPSDPVVPSTSGGSSTFAPSATPIIPGDRIAASGVQDTEDSGSPLPPPRSGGSKSSVNVAQNNQSSTTVNVNATVNAPAAGGSSAPRPTRLKPANSPAGVSLAQQKAAAEAKQRDAQEAKQATRAATARARKDDAGRVDAAPSVAPISTGAPQVRRDSAATGQKAADAARAKSEAANAGNPDIVIQAAQNADMAREVEQRLRDLEAGQSAQGASNENRAKQIEELAKQLGDLSDGKPQVVRQMIQGNPDIRKIVAGIMKDPVAARQLQKKIEQKLKSNTSFKSLSDDDVREISKEQTKVAMRALKKEDPDSLERNSRRPELRDVSREVMDETDDEAPAETAAPEPPTDTSANA